MTPYQRSLNIANAHAKLQIAIYDALGLGDGYVAGCLRIARQLLNPADGPTRVKCLQACNEMDAAVESLRPRVCYNALTNGARRLVRDVIDFGGPF